MRIISQRYIGGGQFMLQLGGLSSETKPTDAFVATGSQFFEDDTDAVFTFSGLTWNLEKNGQMKDLPVVTATDNGKVLKVKDGVWSVGEDGGESGGGAEKFIVTLTQENDTWTADKTVAEIVAADAAGKIVVAKFVLDSAPIEIPLASASSDGTMIVAIFSGFGGIESAFQFTGVYYESDAWEYTETTIPEIPDYSSSNNGQVLGVSSGDLAWVDNYAPLIVTLTAGATEGQFVGNKTHEEAYDAFIAGRNVVFYAPAVNGMAETVTVAENNTSADDPYSLATKSFTSSGAATDYITVTAGG